MSSAAGVIGALRVNFKIIATGQFYEAYFNLVFTFYQILNDQCIICSKYLSQ